MSKLSASFLRCFLARVTVMVAEKPLFARQVFKAVVVREIRPFWLPVTKLVGEIREMKQPIRN